MSGDELLGILETLVDDRSVGMQNILATLAQICIMKSAHIQENWQDAVSSAAWEEASAYITVSRNMIRANTNIP
jgi:hypothetical protein